MFEDAIAGGSTGLLIGLTDGLSLAATPWIAAAGKVGIGTAIGAGMEATRQLSNYGCITSRKDAVLAGFLGAAGAGSGSSVLRATGGEALEGVPSYLLSGLGGITGEALQTQTAANETTHNPP